jgi:predicted GH43/DUF377 family glycosyl hydrolase
MLKRYEKNPILKPKIENHWEARMVFNTAAIYLDGKVHLVYRARGLDGGVSRFGYASSSDGFHFEERFDYPVFSPDPDNDFECMGVEDPRITKIEDRIYMLYTAYGFVPGIARRVSQVQLGMTSIDVDDFLNHHWNWSERIYPLFRVDDKNSFLFPEKIGGKYVMYHRIPPHIWISYSDDLHEWKLHELVMKGEFEWEYFKIGGGSPPHKTDKGWLLVYHAVDRNFTYQLGMAMADQVDPSKIIWRHKEPVLIPEEDYEKHGEVPNVVFTCGSVVIDGTLFVYYGGADTVIGVATAEIDEILKEVK